MPKFHGLLALVGVLLGACATQVIDRTVFPISFTAPIEGTKSSFARKKFDTGFVAYRGIWTGDDTSYSRVYIYAYHYPPGVFGNDRPRFETHLPKLDPSLEKRALQFEPPQRMPGQHAGILFQLFSADDVSCVAFFEHIRINDSTPVDALGDGEIIGYYCAPRGEKLTEADTREFLASLRHRDARKRADKVS